MLEIFQKALNDKRTYLYEHEAYDLFGKVGIKLPRYVYVEKNSVDALELDGWQDNLVVKAVARDLFHKSRVGGVKFIKKADLLSECNKMMKIDALEGFLVVERVSYIKQGVSDFFLVSVRNLRDFGLLASFAIGGTETELFAKHTKGNFVSFIINDDFTVFLEGESWPFKYLSSGAKNELKNFFVHLRELNFLLENLNIKIEELEINPIAFSKDTGKILPLDAVFRFNTYRELAEKKEYNELDALFFPKRVAVVGVSTKKINMGRIILRNFIENGFDKKNLFIVREETREIDGIKCVGSVKELKNIDLLILAVNSGQATELVEELSLLNNVKHIILIPGGFAETDAGKKLEDRIFGALKKTKIGLVGANCLGVISKPAKLDTFFIPKEKLGYDSADVKPFAFISQSGAFIISKLSKINLQAKYAVSTGNQTGLTLSDYFAYFSKRSDINTIALYIEGFKPLDARRLVQLIQKTDKRVILYKAGRTEAGQKAVGGHTASIASDYGVTKDVFKQAGTIITESIAEFEDVLKLSLLLDEYGFSTKLNTLSLFVIANAGFETVASSDNLINGLSFASSSGISNILEKHKLTKLVNANNPLDLTPSALDDVYIDVVRYLETRDDVDFIILSTIPMTPALKSLESEINEDTLFSKLKTFTQKPMALVVDSGRLYDPLVYKFAMPSFREIDRVLRGLEKLL